MGAQKLSLLAERFLQQIQDPCTRDPDTFIITLGGSLITTVAEVSTYLGNAMLKYIERVRTETEGNNTAFIQLLPELQTFRPVTFTTPIQRLELGAGYYDVLDILDSYNSTTLIEAWHKRYLNDALAGINPFYIGSANKPGIIFNKPFLYLFPASLVATANYNFDLQFIKLPVNPNDGKFLDVNGDDDIPFTIDRIQEIADIATELYRIDDAANLPKT